MALGVIGGSRDDPTDAQTVTVDLTNADDTGPGPFTEPVTDPSADPTPAPPTAPAITKPAATATPTNPPVAAIPANKVYPFPRVPSTTGDSPGLYGGTMNTASCNKKQLIRFLTSNPAKAKAWIAAQNGDPSLKWAGGKLTMNNLDTYIDSLTPLVLRYNTYLVNHGYNGGKANPLPEFLLAGNAVLVDDHGVPRARCYCGNPLTRAKGNPQNVRYRGVPKHAFDPQKPPVVVPTASKKPIDKFVVQDLNTGATFTRNAGGDPSTDKVITKTPPTTSPTPSATTMASPTPTALAGSVFNSGFGIVPPPGYDERHSDNFAPYQDVPTIEVAESDVDTWRKPTDNSQSGYSLSDLTRAGAKTLNGFFDDTWANLRSGRQCLSVATDDQFQWAGTTDTWAGREYQLSGCMDTSNGMSQTTALILVSRASDGATVALLVRGPTPRFDAIHDLALQTLNSYQRR